MAKFAARHYEAVADALASARPDGTWAAERDQWGATVRALSECFAADNPKFKRERFAEACASRRSDYCV